MSKKIRKNKEELIENLWTKSEFAKLKGITKQAVQNQVLRGAVEVVQIKGVELIYFEEEKKC